MELEETVVLIIQISDPVRRIPIRAMGVEGQVPEAVQTTPVPREVPALLFYDIMCEQKQPTIQQTKNIYFMSD